MTLRPKRNVKARPSKLRRDETLWGYLFIAAPLLGFVVFLAGPLIGSLAISFTNWNLLSEPEWVGLENWKEVFSVAVAQTPREQDEATGEPLFSCGREDVLASQLSSFEGQVDERTGQPVVCEPSYVRAREVLPRRFGTLLEFNLGSNAYVLGARDALMWESMYNTIYLLLGVPIAIALSLFLAIMLNQKIHGVGLLSAVYYLPNVLPIAATSLIWLWIFNPDFGLLNYFLGFFGVPRISWLQDTATVKPALILMGVWGGVGFGMLIYLAGLQGVPKELYEAAEIDGAGRWAKFRFITWPSLTPTTFFLLITGLIGGFQNFVQPYIMTNGGPYHASTTMVMTIWNNAFRDLEMGYASAQAWLLGVIILIITIVNFILARRWVFYQGAEH